MAKSEKDYAAEVSKMQQQGDQEYIAELKDKYGLDEKSNADLVNIICKTYGVKNIIPLLRNDQLKLKPFNLSYALTTFPSAPDIDKRRKDKDTLETSAQYEKNSRQWLRLLKYFLPSWLYINDSAGISVDWFNYMKMFLKRRPFQTFPSLKSGIEYKEKLGAWKLLAPDELITTYNKHLIKMMEQWG